MRLLLAGMGMRIMDGVSFLEIVVSRLDGC